MCWIQLDAVLISLFQVIGCKMSWKIKNHCGTKTAAKYMKSLLFRPRFEPNKTGPIGSVMPCKKDPNRKKTRGRPCKCCDLLQECETFCFEGSPTPFQLRYNFTCDTRNVLYLVTCLKWGWDYIGNTEREVRERCGEYRLAIENGKFNQGVHKHIYECGGGFVMTPFLKCLTKAYS